MTEVTYFVPEEEAYARLDEFIQRHDFSFPISAIRKAIEDGNVRINSKVQTAGWRLRPGDKVTVKLEGYRGQALEAENVPLEVLYEDAFLIAVNKPPDMLSHPSVKERSGTLLNALLGYYQQKKDVEALRMWPALAHRLDRDTSGVIVAAKQERAVEKLFVAFRDRQMKKVYQAIVFGIPEPEQGVIEAPIGRHPVLWPRWRVMDDGKSAKTAYRVTGASNGFSLVELEPLTGRTHQLRIHLAHIGHPIVGDHTYGRALNKAFAQSHPELKIKHHFLHAATLSFTHPMRREEIHLEAPMPQTMKEFWESGVANEDVGLQGN